MALIFVDVYSGSPAGLEVNPNAQGTIVKATQGTRYINTRCTKQYSAAKKAGRLLGVYHYAAGGNPVAEAQFFIKNINSYVKEAVLILDWEGYQNPAFGDTTWAKKFTDEVHRLTGVYPLVYTSISSVRQVASCASTCGLWVAGYPTNNHSWAVPDFNSYCKRYGYSIAPWTTYTLWQYTGGDIDRSVAAVDAAGWKKLANPSGIAKTVVKSKPYVYSLSGKTLEQLAQDGINGRYASGAGRKKVLGNLYNSVQAIINNRLKVTSTARAQQILAAEVKAGRLGNGADRKKLLGSYYNGVQSLINSGH